MAKSNHTPLAKPKPAVSDKKIKHEIWGVVFVFLGLFTFLSLVSYHHADPSLFSKTNETAKNFGGKIGANLSEVLIQFSGFSAFLISFLSFSFAIRLFQGSNFIQLTGKAFWILMAILSTATLLSLQFETISYGGAHFPAGGVFGGWIASSLKHYLNTIGTSLFTFSVLLISLVQSTPFSAAKFFLFLSRVSLIGFGQAIRYSIIFVKKFLQTFSAVFVQAMKEIPAIQAKIAEKKIEKAFTAEKNQPAEIITQNTQAAASVNSADDILADFTDIPATDTATPDRSLKVIERKKKLKNQF